MPFCPVENRLDLLFLLSYLLVDITFWASGALRGGKLAEVTFLHQLQVIPVAHDHEVFEADLTGPWVMTMVVLFLCHCLIASKIKTREVESRRMWLHLPEELEG